MSRFIIADRKTNYLMPPSVEDWLNQDHLARFVVEIVEQLDLSELTRAYGGRGSEAFHPAMLVAMLFYGCATGVFSSRKLERATFDSVAMRYVAANQPASGPRYDCGVPPALAHGDQSVVRRSSGVERARSVCAG